MSHALHDVASGTLFGVALNYRGLLQQHQAAFVEAPYKQLPVKPVLFVKTPNTRNQHEGQCCSRPTYSACNLARRWVW
jgi:5-oxopent-3-ene-1,2,5-tricarboxylate decarboxylase/2-hydroxyhepta-2,4-diene-1,7-dioate isomerase